MRLPFPLPLRRIGENDPSKIRWQTVEEAKVEERKVFLRQGRGL
jgi:hypothetical protein